MAARAGFEPATKWLTATCSTAELPSILFAGLGVRTRSRCGAAGPSLRVFDLIVLWYEKRGSERVVNPLPGF